MPDFGKGGKITIRKDENAVMVDITNGEYLFYKLTAEGAVPIFAFACQHTDRLSSDKDFPGHPKSEYEWSWSKRSDESDAAIDVYVVGMAFATAIKYTLLVEHRDKNNNKIKTLKDLDLESQVATDHFKSSIDVFKS